VKAGTKVPAFFFLLGEDLNLQSYFCYVLWSPVGQKFYIGMTENITARLAQHNAGLSRWSKRYAGSWELVWHRQFDSLREARQFEADLKRHRGGNGFFAATGLSRRDAAGS